MKRNIITYKNKEYTTKEFSGEFGINVNYINRGIHDNKSIDTILAIPRRSNSKVIYNNKSYKLSEFAEEFGINISTIKSALISGVGITEFMNKMNQKSKPNKTLGDLINDINTIPGKENYVESNAKHKEEYTCKIVNPIILRNTNELVSMVKTYTEQLNTEINLIDYENITGDIALIKKLVKEPNSINIFYFNACEYSNIFFKTVNNLTSYNNIYYMTTMEAESQLVDHLMLYYAGVLSEVCKDYLFDVHINLVSKDTHFYKVQKYISDITINAKGMNYIDNKDDKFILSISKYIINNKYINNRTAIKANEFDSMFGNFFKMKNKKITKENMNNLVNKLVDLEFLEYNPETNNYSEYYTFNLTNVKQELRRLKKSRA